MINIDKNQFEAKKKGNKVFSIISEFRGDDITPIRIYNGLSSNRKFILEGGTKGESFGRYSFIGENPYLEIQGDDIEKYNDVKEATKVDFDVTTNKFSFKGGAIGYIGYETIGFFEKKLIYKNEDEIKAPTVRFAFYNNYICYDHFTHKVYVIDNVTKEDKRTYEEIIEGQRDYINKLIDSNMPRTLKSEKGKIELEFNTTKEQFIKAVKKAKEHIVNGDIFQIVLSQRMYCKTEKSAFEIYRRLREENPSPYMFLIDYEEYSVIGSSPESLVSLKNKKLTTNPIAGTRKRGITESEDNSLAESLLSDEKELAEHIMLVDLGRNDIGKVSEVGTVDVKEFMQIEKFSHVMHITTKVVGDILEDKDAFDGLIACLPAGTVSGAPKIRAMEIIEELEQCKRGIYSGAVGYFSFGGDMDMCIAIRTLILKNQIAYLQAGAGIVYDSVPEKEFEEIQNKLMVLKEVLK